MEPGEFDLVGFAVGVVERARVLPEQRAARRRRSSASPARGSAATATRSPAGRCSIAPAAGSTTPRGPARTTRSADELIRPSVIYAPAMRKLRERVDVHAFAHVTGGGLPDNLARVLPGALRRGGAARRVGRAADLRRDPGRGRRPRRRDGARLQPGSRHVGGCRRPRTGSLPWTQCARPVTKRGSSERCRRPRSGKYHPS